jgi:hypothetical protein
MRFNMTKPMISFALAAFLGLSGSACSRGGRSPNWHEQTYSKSQPSPGSGQTGPGMTKQANNVNGPNDSAFAYPDNAKAPNEQR